VFHAAGVPEGWQTDEASFDRVNRQGTANVMAAALAANVKRVVLTSSMGVFGAPPGGTVTEASIDREPRPSAYIWSKRAAELEAASAAQRGLDVVIVNPSAIYGPSPTLTTLNQFFANMLAKKLPMLPPLGMSVVFVEGLADAHVRAAERGRRGERYLVSDRYVTNRDLAAEIARQGGLSKLPPTAPLWLLRVISAINTPISRLLRKKPLVAKSDILFLENDVRGDATKAQRELGFVPTPLEDGVRKTVESLKRGS
jgi:nucleoside-diphosphate-sugar epimerase